MTPFFVSGYPKSYTTYLARLIGDVLDCPVGGSISSDDKKEPATEGLDRKGSFIVRKGHYRLIEDSTLPLIPKAHTLNLAKYTTEPIIFIIRDPRDIVVSGAFYHRKTFLDYAKQMIEGQLYGLLRWDEYINEWTVLTSGLAQFIRGEDLLDDPESILRWYLTVSYDESRLKPAIERQSFENRKRDDKHRLLRSGKSGEYKKYLDKKIIDMIESEFKDVMLEFDYL